MVGEGLGEGLGTRPSRLQVVERGVQGMAAPPCMVPWIHAHLRFPPPPSHPAIVIKFDLRCDTETPTCQTITHTRPKEWSTDVWFASKEQCALDETYSVEYTWSDKIKPSEPSKGSSYHYT